jgi:hypothetical protein
MKELSMDPKDYNLSDPVEIQRFLMTGQAELLDSLNTLESDFSIITEVFSQTDVSSADANKLLQLDKVLHPYIQAFICIHVYYQQLLKIRHIDTPRHWPDKYYNSEV